MIKFAYVDLYVKVELGFTKYFWGNFGQLKLWSYVKYVSWKQFEHMLFVTFLEKIFPFGSTEILKHCIFHYSRNNWILIS